MMKSSVEELCAEKGLRMSRQREMLAQVLSESNDHPSVQQIHERALKKDPKISIATVYRTMRLLTEAGIAREYDFGDTKARYEEVCDEPHDHLVDVNTGKIIEFHNEEIETLQNQIASKLGYDLIGYKLELYATPSKKK